MARPVLRNSVMSVNHPSKSIAAATSDALTDLFGRPLVQDTLKCFAARKATWPAGSSSLQKALHFLQLHYPPTFSAMTCAEVCSACGALRTTSSSHMSHVRIDFSSTTPLERAIVETFSNIHSLPKQCASCSSTAPSTTHHHLSTNESLVIYGYSCPAPPLACTDAACT